MAAVIAIVLFVFLIAGIAYYAHLKTTKSPGTNIVTDSPIIVTGDYISLRDTFLAYVNDGKILVDSQNPVNDVKNNKITEQTLRTALSTADYALSQNKKIKISVFMSGHSCPGSLHCAGKAFDIGNEEIANILMPWLFNGAKELKIDELIFDNNMIGRPSNVYNLDKGVSHSYSGSLLMQHANHIHLGTF